MGLFSKDPSKLQLIDVEQALPGRAEEVPVPDQHFVNGESLKGPFPDTLQQLVVGLGCFWGAERKFWQVPGVVTTAAGYAGGFSPNPSYEEVCSGRTGHSEVVLVVFNPQEVSLAELLQLFWESHDPTQGMRQGNDVGTQYRSVLYVTQPDQLAVVERSQALYQAALTQAGLGTISTEVAAMGADRPFYYAEHYHQQYLAKVPNGYCGIGGTGVGCDMKALVSL